jgi:serine palmitoyltransferase
LKDYILTRIGEQALANGVLITRMKTIPDNVQPKQAHYVTLPALKVCLTTGLSRKEVEKAGTIIRHAITKVMRQKR